MRAVALEQTLLLLNNFITNTTTFLNVFADSCEKKISTVSAKINEIEITLAVLEAKLNSIPGLDFQGTDLPPAAPTVDVPAAAPPISSSTSIPPAAAVPDTAPVPQDNVPPAAAVVDQEQSGKIAAKDHPDYARFFKLIRLGVPPPVVAAKISAEGLDPSVLDDPERMLDKPESIEALD
jgi:WASH complex subunit CCDC53